jgi:hypothetical protein
MARRVFFPKGALDDTSVVNEAASLESRLRESQTPLELLLLIVMLQSHPTRVRQERVAEEQTGRM